jgi:Transcriptional regulator
MNDVLYCRKVWVRLDTKIKSLSKALNLLECFSVERPELGITDLCNMLGLYKSNVHNIVSTLEKHGYLMKNPQTSKYRLGTRILRLSHIISKTLRERDFILPHITQIANETEEVVYYGVLHGRSVMYLDYAHTTSNVSSGTMYEISRMGATAPVHCTATGKAMLAYLPRHELDDILDGPFQAFTDRTIVRKELMLIELEKIRERGYSIDNMEHEYGVKGVGVPILNSEGFPIAAISVAGPSLRFDDTKIEYFAGILKKHVAEIRSQMP